MNIDKRIILYPHYITSGKTVAEGRRIPSNLACSNPNVIEMYECCRALSIPCQIEGKTYPRDWFIKGRLRVQLFNADGTPVNPTIPTRRDLMIKIAELWPSHRRPMPQQGGTKVVETPAAAASSSSATPPAASGSSKNNKKKNKK
uniref:Signal recognition particle 19 kDa protein n=1 Tax=Polytomella parva TaxID=51329 RepID=A0A7S0YF51_9CHLO|mmetsp:Transcript_2321/g.3507  ORF Transcript_2321/g.3507 Transcript_2321/m.3507 type:complete len:145 (+) Transcript_2321:138-572(+)